MVSVWAGAFFDHEEVVLVGDFAPGGPAVFRGQRHEVAGSSPLAVPPPAGFGAAGACENGGSCFHVAQKTPAPENRGGGGDGRGDYSPLL